MNPLSIAELALGFSANTCFGLMSSKWGAQKAGRLGAGSIAFGLAALAISIFTQASKKQPPPPLSQADLKAATDNLRVQIAEDAFSEEVIDKLAPLQTLAKEVDAAIKRALADAKSNNRFDPELDDILNKDWASYYAAFKKTDGYQKQCLDTTQWVADHDHRKFDTMDLYQLAASLYLNICQICLMVEWNEVLNDPEAESTWRTAFIKYRKDVKAYQADHKAWVTERDKLADAQRYAQWPKDQFGAPNSNPGFYWDSPGGNNSLLGGSSGTNYLAKLRAEPKMPTPPPTPPRAYTQLKTSIFATAIKDNVADFIAYAEPIVSLMESLLIQHEKISNFVDNVQIEQPPKYTSYIEYFMKTRYSVGSYFFPDDASGQVINTATGEVWTRAWRPLASRQAEILRGIERSGLLDDPLIATNHLNKDQVANFRKTLDNWKETQKAYAFATDSI